MNAILALEDGTVMRGQAFGARASACGEVCFNTSMTGYQEILTDPSYKGQIVAMTYPLIGNYGINRLDVESWQPHVAGFVVRELSPLVSNWRSEMSLPDYLQQHRIPGIQGLDTRALTKKLRVHGALKGMISTEDLSDSEAVNGARQWQGLIGIDYVREVTHPQPFSWDSRDEESGDFRLSRSSNEANIHNLRHPLPPAEIPVVAYDFGIKYNILRRLRQRGFQVTVVPAHTPADTALQYKPSGIFLSNGPGDPAALGYAVRAVSDLINTGVPVFGICLGHQIIGQALGGKTFKLKFGHRGANQPVKNLRTGQVEITSQNHGFAVDPHSLPSHVEVDRINLNDQTVEGMRHRHKPVFCVQYHPEASPGPHDSSVLFDEFRELIRRS
ncbi:MAG TPA: glutamine-hydrolyzing carbamoyl-phosphate synthase small subunit [Candidatus Paceibacterota bacterium]|nr:glutamine-hydrolyzing carbamoyl-phosphate synthase small subunit [Verrucomicrobiota bacterium]HRY46776.1 glutamine-hydrolyzing carbamoyl-phosphate synthase small subunit [Candidatus Paceibacterota bacterium]HSA01757.1 glutamine-hydrolyzing carbamoyl-phosphate synthase small subunit [Candidatus Paceibacterota bacterium]